MSNHVLKISIHDEATGTVVVEKILTEKFLIIYGAKEDTGDDGAMTAHNLTDLEFEGFLKRAEIAHIFKKLTYGLKAKLKGAIKP